MRFVDKISLVFLAIGVFVIGFSTKQWRFAFPDKSNFYFGLMAGLFFILFAEALHNRAKVSKEKRRVDGMLKILWKGKEDWEDEE